MHTTWRVSILKIFALSSHMYMQISLSFWIVFSHCGNVSLRSSLEYSGNGFQGVCT